MMGITRHFSGGEEPWQLRESSVGGGIRARALAEFIVRQSQFIVNSRGS
jgi:hypothetical protein